jgi:hypothetical protein
MPPVLLCSSPVCVAAAAATACSAAVLAVFASAIWSYRPGLYIFKVALSDVIYIERVIKN